MCVWPPGHAHIPYISFVNLVNHLFARSLMRVHFSSLSFCTHCIIFSTMWDNPFCLSLIRRLSQWEHIAPNDWRSNNRVTLFKTRRKSASKSLQFLIFVSDVADQRCVEISKYLSRRFGARHHSQETILPNVSEIETIFDGAHTNKSQTRKRWKTNARHNTAIIYIDRTRGGLHTKRKREK